MAVELRTRIEGFYRTRDEESVPSVGVYRGQLTAEARKASGFESRVNLIGGRGKTRFDRRHHAMDALVIALMNPSVSCTLALRVNMRDAQRLAGREETWKNFYGKPGEASRRFESWRQSMLLASELFNSALSANAIPFLENKRLRANSSAMHEATQFSFSHAKPIKKGSKILKEKGEQRMLGAAMSVDLIDRAETPALWTALTRCPDFDPKNGLPANPERTITVNGTHVGPTELLNFFGSTSACLKVRGGYVKLANSIHHARIYRIGGKKTTYAMVRVFQVDLLHLKDRKLLKDGNLFEAPLKPSSISIRTADKKIRRALAEGTAKQIGWLVEGDELQIDTSKYTGGLIEDVLTQYPEAVSWRVAGFADKSKLRLRPYLLSAEGLDEDAPQGMKELLEGRGWRPAVNVLFSPRSVVVVRRNCLGEQRKRLDSGLPITEVLR